METELCEAKQTESSRQKKLTANCEGVRHVHGCHAWSTAHKSTSLQRMPDKDCSGASLAVLGQQKGGIGSCELTNHDTHSGVQKNAFDSCVCMERGQMRY